MHFAVPSPFLCADLHVAKMLVTHLSQLYIPRYLLTTLHSRINLPINLISSQPLLSYASQSPQVLKLNQRCLRWGTGDVCSQRSLYILRPWQLVISHRTAAVVQAYCWQGPWGIFAVSRALPLPACDLAKPVVVGPLTLSYSTFSQFVAGMYLCQESKWSWMFICFCVFS